MTGSDDPSKREENGETVARLVSLAGARRSPDTSIEASVRLLVKNEWRAAVRRQRRQLRLWIAAGGIGAALALAWTGMYFKRDAPPEVIGTLVGTRGPVQLVPAVRPLNASGDALFAGAHLQTGQGAAALLSVRSIGLRLGAGSELVLESATAVRLVTGRLYIDSAAVSRGHELTVRTPFGTLSHRGTQYQIQVQPGRSLLAMVREGRVDIRAYGHDLSLGAGEQVRVTGAGTFSREAAPTYGDAWNWTGAYVPEVAIEGRSLASFLTWFARETGRSLRYATPGLQADAEQTRLSGNVRGLTPEQALEAILAATGFQAVTTAAGEIRVVSRSHTPATAKMEPHARMVLPGGGL
jgi:hypothetical protein